MPSDRLSHRLRGGLALTALTAGWCLLPGTAQAAPAPAPAASHPAYVALPQHAQPAGVPAARHPLDVAVRGHDKQGHLLLAAGAPGGYTAAELRAAVGLKGTGAGQTVAIVDAFDDPYAVQDLNAYSTQMGLPGVCAPKQKPTKHSDCFPFTQIRPANTPLDVNWGIETSLDIEMVHALVPQAHITLVEAADNSLDALFQADDLAASLHPGAISNSWGLQPPNTEDPSETTFDSHCAPTDGVCVYSSGDSGNPGGYPAYNPHVLSVGGTSLSLDRAGTILGETAWSHGGGGISQFEPRPAYQPDTLNPSTGRGIPDVSFNADPLTGVAIYYSGASALGDSANWLQAGGTSAGAPAWSAILAAADQLRAAAGKPALTSAGDEVQNAVYHLTSGLADITSGTNGSCGAVCTAGPGYDFVTGLGSPRPGIDTALAAAQ